MLLPAGTVSAQVFGQNQLILSPYGSNGFVVSTTTKNGAKLSASSTPYFSRFSATNGTISYASTTALSTTLFWITGQSAGCAQFDGGAKLTSTGLSCGADSFTHIPVYGQTTSATSTLISLTGSPFSLVASSTSWFDQINVGSTTVGGMSTSTFYGNVEVKGRLRDDSVTSALILDDAAGLAGPYGGTSCTNQFVRSLNGAGVASCNSVADTDFTGQLGAAHGGTGKDFSASTGVIVDYAGTFAATASSTLYGTGIGGQYLVWANGVPSWIASTTYTGTSPMSLTFSAATGQVTASIANAAADGSTKGAASFTANDFDASTGNISLDYTNGQAASASAKGFLTSADWSTFNGKLNFSNLWNISTNFGTTTRATTTPEWFMTGLFASSTSQLQYASTTQLSAVSLCLTGDVCRTTWPTSGSGGGDPFTHPAATRSATSTMIEFTGGLMSLASTTLGAPAATTTVLGPLMIGNTAANGTMLGSTTMLQISSSTNSFMQALLWNTNTGSNASTELVFNNNHSTNLSWYSTIGINGGNYNNALFSGERPDDMFVSASDGGLEFSLASTTASDATSSIDFLTKGTLSSNLRFRITNSGLSMFGTSTAAWGLLTLASSTAPQLLLSDNTAADNLWTLRSISNSFFLATSSGRATSTTASFSINPNGIVGTPMGILSNASSTFTQGLWAAFQLGIATTTTDVNSGIGFNIATSTTFNGLVAFPWASTTVALQPTNKVVYWPSGKLQRFVATTTMTIEVNSTSSHPYDGMISDLKICQDSTGGRAVTFTNFSSGFIKFSMGTPTPPTAANTAFHYLFMYDARPVNSSGGQGIYEVLAATSTPFGSCQ